MMIMRKLAVLLAFIFIPGVLFALDSFDLSYTLEDGGFSLQLSKAYPLKGVTLQVTSDVSTRYEVRQRIINPLQSRENPGIALGDNFIFRGLIGTNKFGNLRVPVSDTTMRTDELLYVSDNNGSADSFSLAFGVRNFEDLAAGHYSGRIAFVLNPIASARPQVTKILDVYVTIEKEPGQGPAIEISALNGGKTITLNPNREDLRSADVLVKINGKFSSPFKIVQRVPRPIESSQGDRLDREAVVYNVKDARIGVGANRSAPLSTLMATIYSSAASGDADNYFTISYGLGDFSGQKAGRYTGKIEYFLETITSQSRLDTIDLEIQNDRIFDLKITALDQKYAIEFTNVKPGEEPRQSEVAIEIFNNTGQQYQVTQDVVADLTNKEGGSIPSKYFTMRTEGLESKGKPRIAQWEEVKKGSSVIFVSDAQGSADKFKAVYKLESAKELRMGDYSSRITYSLSEL
ncbi:MAG: hypothetical protein PHN59_00605 [Candidatus Omnitrophica bacterium]|nr:hypothetical protein [Candidatus Omnitrophota bacterium]